MFQQVITILKKEILLEWRQRYAFNAILLYLFSTVFVCYLGLNLKGANLNPIVWNTLFWIIILFTAVNAVAKSFLSEREERSFYYYQLVDPGHLILAKSLYNCLLLMILILFGLGIYSLVLGNPVQNMGLFTLVACLAAIGLSLAFTLISAIASKTQNSNTMMAILGFPVIIPLLMLVIDLSKKAMDGIDIELAYKNLVTLSAVNLMIGAAAYILFPYLWRS